MRAAVLHAAGDLRVEDREVPSPGPGEVLVRVAVCGVCGTDATEYDRGPVLTVPPGSLERHLARLERTRRVDPGDLGTARAAEQLRLESPVPVHRRDLGIGRRDWTRTNDPYHVKVVL